MSKSSTIYFGPCEVLGHRSLPFNEFIQGERHPTGLKWFNLMKKKILFTLIQTVLLSPLNSNAAFGFVRLNIGDLSIQSDRFQGFCSEKIMKDDENDNTPYVIYSNLQLQKTLSASEQSKCQSKPNFNFVKVSFNEDSNSGILTIAEGQEQAERTFMPKEKSSADLEKTMIGYHSDSIVVSPIDITVYKVAHTMTATSEDLRNINFTCLTESEKKIRPASQLFAELTERVVSCHSDQDGVNLSFKLRLKLDLKD